MSEKKTSAKDRSVLEACGGSEEARSSLLDVIRPKLCFAAEMMTGDPEEADRIVSSYSEHAFDKPYLSFREWEAAALEGVRLLCRDAVDMTEPEYPAELPEVEPDAAETEDPELEPFEKEMILRDVFSSLEPACREILLMRYFQKLTVRKIAKLRETGIPETEKLLRYAETSAAAEVIRLETERCGRAPLQFFKELTEEKRSGRAMRAKRKERVIVYDLPEDETSLPPADRETELAVISADKERAGKILGFVRRTVVLILIAALSFLAIPVKTAFDRKEAADREKAHTNALQSLQISFKTEDGREIQEFEYGSEGVPVRNLVESHSGNLEIIGNAYIDMQTCGRQETVFRLSSQDEYGEPVVWDVVRHYSVLDSKGPVITLKSGSVSSYAGEAYNPRENIESVTDEVEGQLAYLESEPAELENDAEGRLYEKGWYVIQHNINTNAAGSYKVRVIASDNHGNRSEAEYSVGLISLWEGARDTSITRGTRAGNKIYLYNYLTGTLGMTRAAACGVLANICQESSFRPEALDTAWDGTPYYGICQWGGGRLNGLYSYCESHGYDSGSLEGQAAYLGYELRGTYSFVYNGMMACPNTAKGAFDAAEIFRSQYEVSAFTATISQTAAAYFVNE